MGYEFQTFDILGYETEDPTLARPKNEIPLESLYKNIRMGLKSLILSGSITTRTKPKSKI